MNSSKMKMTTNMKQMCMASYVLPYIMRAVRSYHAICQRSIWYCARENNIIFETNVKMKTMVTPKRVFIFILVFIHANESIKEHEVDS